MDVKRIIPYILNEYVPESFKNIETTPYLLFLLAYILCFITYSISGSNNSSTKKYKRSKDKDELISLKTELKGSLLLIDSLTKNTDDKFQKIQHNFTVLGNKIGNFNYNDYKNYQKSIDNQLKELRGAIFLPEEDGSSENNSSEN